MIQSVLIFILGFLSALFLALLALPAVWRRAVRLTRRGIEASMPLTAEEISASIDQARAQHAVTLRRVELERDEAVNKASMLVVTSAKEKRKLERLSAERAELRERNKQLEAEFANLQEQLRSRDELVTQFANKTKEVEDVLAERIDELSRINNLYEEATLASTARQVEVVARENEVERLSRQLAKFRRERSDVLKKIEEVELRGKDAVDAQEEPEQLRGQDLELRLERAISEIADKDDALAQRDQEIKWLRQEAESEGSVDLRLVDLQKENLRLTSTLETLRSGPLDSQMAPGAADDALRETMHQLAADVVNMVAGKDEHSEAIDRALAGAGDQPDTQAKMTSLASRIRRRRKS